MYSEITEWEARGDGLREAKRFGEALEAYRTALRHCFQWTHEPKACDGIREKIWAVQVEEFQGYAARASSRIDAETRELMGACHTPDVLEHVLARLLVCGARNEAEQLASRALRDGLRGSGEFLDRLADRSNGDFADSLRAYAQQVRGGGAISSSPQGAQPAAAAVGSRRQG
jgi:hypothetical protein